MADRVVMHREIGIDAGHRVPDHGSKCRSPHGHRYHIVATCEGPVLDINGHEENGMVVDFGNVKKYMMDVLDGLFDHAFIVAQTDKSMMNMFFPGENPDLVGERYSTYIRNSLEAYIKGDMPRIEPIPSSEGEYKVVVVPYVPTAENLAKHMYELLRKPIRNHYSDGSVDLINLRLFETPNGYVDYPGMLYNR